MKLLKLTERQALLCERALELIEGTPDGWQQFEKDINDFSGQQLTEAETERLKGVLRGDIIQG